MQYLILAFVLLFVVYAALSSFLKANPKTMVQNLRTMGGVAALLIALFFIVTGRFPLAVPLGFIALSLLRGKIAGFAGGFNPFPGNATKSEGQQSRVRTRTIEMELDHDTGDMEGRVTRGRFASRLLSSMNENELVELWNDCLKPDPQAAQLLEAYLDRRMPEWREGAGSKAKQNNKAGGPSDGPMSGDEAYEVLGLQPGANNADIRRAHRKLMKKMHPDQGGSTYLAAKINEAKDLLLGQ
jgi:DnaJ-domain-containing protein 1